MSRASVCWLGTQLWSLTRFLCARHQVVLWLWSLKEPMICTHPLCIDGSWATQSVSNRTWCRSTSATTSACLPCDDQLRAELCNPQSTLSKSVSRYKLRARKVVAGRQAQKAEPKWLTAEERSCKGQRQSKQASWERPTSELCFCQPPNPQGKPVEGKGTSSLPAEQRVPEVSSSTPLKGN